ncbi:D-aminoacyl-tRNA deacylase [Halovenus rubra]|uniref:D-aminoacyl-tRNA deacylase n=2 Tax=Halovenus rubra TaxID=869890 RepID=A0ABD5X4I5_9EURY|nr:D-aminoacyl-tRNA deacylase [Halovenus rubra]
MLGIIVSRADSASVHIGEHLRELADWDTFDDGTRCDAAGGGTVYETDGAQLREFDALHLDLVRPADAFDDPDFLVFASRHSGQTGPLLTAHHTGNVGPAEHGGTDNDLATACPNALRTVFDALDAYSPGGYEVGIEATHHGPSVVGAPSMFVEVGSAKEQWEDPEAARAVGQAILALRESTAYCRPENGSWSTSDQRGRCRQLVGIGGGHYAPRFRRVMAETDWAVGHVLADWGLDTLENPATETVIEQAFEATNSNYALVEGDRAELTEVVESLGYRAVSETWVRETDGVPLGFVRAMEADIGSIDDGLRFGKPARNHIPEEYHVVDLPTALLDEARGINREAASNAVAEAALAFGTDQGGTRPTGTVVLPPETERAVVIETLLAVLSEKYDSIERDKETVIARQEVFNSEKAQTLGVPQGPAFGRLAAGEPVEVDGETIPPAAVHEEKTTRFSLSE